MRVLTSLADYEHALNNIQPHSLRRAVFNVLKERSDDMIFLSNAKCNLLALEKSQAIRRRLIDLKDVLSFLEKITSEENVRYALIKVQPFITHLWNDVDMLVLYKDVSNMINAARRYFGDVTVVGRPSRSGVTLYIKRLSLRLDLYAAVGWRGLLVIKNSNNVMFSHLVKDNLAYCGESYEIQVLTPELDTLIQLIHAYQSENAITLADFIKVLLSINLDFSSVEHLFVVPPAMILQFFSRTALKMLRELLVIGRIAIPLIEKAVVSLHIILENLKLRNINFRSYYYEVEQLISYIFSSRGKMS
ncbi:MAG: hypothetical protein QXL22_03735 [Candidatus Nezhaarchaeales archaeon]